MLNNKYRNLYEKLYFCNVFFFICLSISGCSEFDNILNDEFNSSFVFSCIEEYEKNLRIQISRSEFLSYCKCVHDGLKGSNNRVEYSKLLPGNVDDRIDYCIEREINPLSFY
mgnify:CR=1 FL=1